MHVQGRFADALRAVVGAVLRVLDAGAAAGSELADRSELPAGKRLRGAAPLQRLEQRGAAAGQGDSGRRQPGDEPEPDPVQPAHDHGRAAARTTTAAPVRPHLSATRADHRRLQQRATRRHDNEQFAAGDGADGVRPARADRFARTCTGRASSGSPSRSSGWLSATSMARPSSLRALAPQRCAEPFAEWHSMFDTGSGGTINSNMATYNEIVNRESAQYPDPPTDPTAAPTADPAGNTRPVPARSACPWRRADDHRRDALAGQTVPFDFSPASGDSWPDYRPFGLKLVPGTNPSQNAVQAVNVDTTNRLITFTLTKGDTVILNLCSTCDTADIPLFGAQDSMVRTVRRGRGRARPVLVDHPRRPGGARVRRAAAAADARVPQSPDAATRRRATRLLRSRATSPTAPRARARSIYWRAGAIRSTIRSITCPSRDPARPNPNLRPTTNSPVATVPSATNPLANAGSQLYTATDRFSARHEFFDTKHRNVTYHGVATSQFSEFYPPGTNVTKSDGASGARRHPVERPARTRRRSPTWYRSTTGN